MKCPYCKEDNNRCHFCGQSKKDKERLGYYRRKRKCLSCGRTFWTVEEYVEDEIAQAKKYKRRPKIKTKRGGLRA